MIQINSMRYSKLSTSLIEGLCMKVSKGELISILGPSGIGKTTILRIIAGLETEYDGFVEYLGTPILKPTRNIQIMFQDNRLYPWLTVNKNIEFAFSNVKNSNIQVEIARLLEHVGLKDRGNSWPNELSGGEITRIALARALAGNPEVLLLDEPFANLDISLKNALYGQLLEEVKKNKITLIMVTHSIDDALAISDKVFIIKSKPIKTMISVPINISHPRTYGDESYRAVATEIMNLLIN